MLITISGVSQPEVEKNIFYMYSNLCYFVNLDQKKKKISDVGKILCQMGFCTVSFLRTLALAYKILIPKCIMYYLRILMLCSFINVFFVSV